MLKFDLTRKYLVGFLTLAMVFSLFALPVAATPDPIVNGATYNPIDPSIKQLSVPPVAAAQNWTFSNTVFAGAHTADAIDPGTNAGTSTRIVVLDVVLRISTYHVWYTQRVQSYNADGSSLSNTSTIFYLVTTSPTNWSGGTAVTGIPTKVTDVSILIDGTALATFKIWYDNEDSAGKKSICYADSNNGYAWNSSSVALGPVGPIGTLTSTLEWRGGLTVLKLADNDYRMWMTGQLIDDPKTQAIYYATSSNGTGWSTYPSVPINQPPSVIIGDTASQDPMIRYWRPDVTNHEGKFQVWAEYSNGAGFDDVRYATSNDGISWSNPPITVLTGNRTLTTSLPQVKNIELPKVVYHPTLGYLMYFYAQPYADASHWYTSRDVHLMYLPEYSFLTPTPPTDTNTANVVGATYTHTITITVKDQFGVAATGTVAYSLSTAKATALSPASPLALVNGQAAVTLTQIPTSGTFTGITSFTDTVTFTPSQGLVVSNSPTTALKTWIYDPSYSITLTPTDETNPNSPGIVTPNTHTVTAVILDQYGNPPAAPSTVYFTVTGTNSLTGTKPTNSTGTATYTYTSTHVGVDTITASYAGTSTSVLKHWEARAPFSKTFTQGGTTSPSYNMVGTNHTVTGTILDQFGDLYAGSVTATFSVSRYDGDGTTVVATWTATQSITNGRFSYVWTSDTGGMDIITLTTSPNLGGALTLTKYWAYEYNVGPLEEINIIGSPHDFVIKGAPFQHFNGQLYHNDHGLIKITDFHGTGPLAVSSGMDNYTVPPDETDFNETFTCSGYLDSTGSATITVYGKSPYKFYLEVNFENVFSTPITPWIGYVGTSFNPLRTITETNYQVAKIYAWITGFTLTPAYDLNTITTNTASDTHEVSVLVWGKYLLNGVESATVPIANAKVDWTVNYSDAFDRNYVSSTVDLGGNPTQDIAGSLKATSYTDVNGLATLKYSLVTTASFHIWPLFDHITAYVHYSDLVLDTDYPPPPTQTVTKEWRDYGFKLIKVVLNDYTQTLTNVAFYLKTGTNTFYYLDGNASVEQSDNYTVKTDTYGAAIWYHLPNGTYDVYEIAPPGYVQPTDHVYTFTVPDIGYWHGNGTLFTTYISNTPTTHIPTGYVSFNKMKWDRTLPGVTPDTATIAAGVVFTAHNETTVRPDLTSTSAILTGKVEFNNIPVGTVTEWYLVSETPPVGFADIPDFYFYIPVSGTWNGLFYSQMTASSTYVLGTVYPYLSISPTIYNYRGQVEFHKLTYCYQDLPGAKFSFINLTDGLVKASDVTSTATGRVSSGLLPVTNSATTWYRVNETFVPAGYTPISDFYFYLPPDGKWNDKFYQAADITSTEVWPWSARPEVGTYRHWVIDQAAQAAVVTTIVVDPATGTYNLATQATLTVTVTVKDQLGNGVPNRAVTPVITGNASLNTATITTNVLGKATFILTASTTGPVIFSATVDSINGLGNYLWTSAALAINSLAATPSVDVATWNPVTISANSPLSGTWSGKIYTPLGVEIGTLTGATGMTFSATWAPLEVQNFVGDGYYAVVNLTDGITTLTNTVTFSVYNYKIKITGVALLDASWTPITNPTAGQAFYVKVDIKNMFTGVVASAFVPVMIDVTYIGAGGLGGLISGQTGSAYILCSGLTAGAHTGYAYVWVDTGGTPIALPITFAITVNP